ncbi:MAG: septum formation protein [Neolewinella sp.]|jgi:septum formation protein
MQISPDLHIVLASKSPRRSYLLEQAGIPFIIRTADVEEVYPESTPVLDVAPYLAELKAEGAVHLLESDQEVLLTADSVVIIDDVIYGKPKNREEAIETLEKLSGVSHTVVTGCCLKSHTRKEVFSAVAEVHLDEMTRDEIEWYVDTYKPYDKAGSYAIQEWVGLAKINRIEGTYPTIMGLPVHLVYDRLVKWGK